MRRVLRPLLVLWLLTLLFISECSDSERDEFGAVWIEPSKFVTTTAELCGNGLDDNRNGLIDEDSLCPANTPAQNLSFYFVGWDQSDNNPIFGWSRAEIVISGRLVCLGKDNNLKVKDLPKSQSGSVFIDLPEDNRPYRCQAQGYSTADKLLWSVIFTIGV